MFVSLLEFLMGVKICAPLLRFYLTGLTSIQVLNKGRFTCLTNCQEYFDMKNSLYMKNSLDMKNNLRTPEASASCYIRTSIVAGSDPIISIFITSSTCMVSPYSCPEKLPGSESPIGNDAPDVLVSVSIDVVERGKARASKRCRYSANGPPKKLPTVHGIVAAALEAQRHCRRETLVC